MRTTITLDDRLLAQAKRQALESGRTLAGLIEDSLRETLARRTAPTRREVVRLPTCGSGGLQPGVDLDSSSSLLDAMEGR